MGKDNDAINLFGVECEHGSLKRQCYICELEEEIRNLKLFFSEKNEYKKMLMINNDIAYYTDNLAVCINNYGDHYKIRMYKKVDNKWVNQVTK